MFPIKTKNGVGLLLVCLFVLVARSIPLAGAADGHSFESDMNTCRTRIEAYCRAWMESRYEAMHAMLSPNGMGAMNKVKFIDSRRKLAGQGVKLLRFEIGKASRIEPESPTLDVFLEFAKAVPPGIVNGQHKFHMVKTGGQWLIRYITPPLSPPGNVKPAGATGPGM